MTVPGQTMSIYRCCSNFVFCSQESIWGARCWYLNVRSMQTNIRQLDIFVFGNNIVIFSTMLQNSVFICISPWLSALTLARSVVAHSVSAFFVFIQASSCRVSAIYYVYGILFWAHLWNFRPVASRQGLAALFPVPSWLTFWSYHSHMIFGFLFLNDWAISYKWNFQNASSPKLLSDHPRRCWPSLS